MKTIEYTQKDFDWVKWTPKDIEKVADEIISFQKNVNETIKNIPVREKTFQNTVEYLEIKGTEISPKINSIDILLEASPDKKVRDAAKRAIEKLQKELVELAYDEGVYNAIREYSNKKEKLLGEEKKLLSDTLRDYKRMGFDLPPEKRKLLKKNIKEIGKLASSFSKNINDHKDHIVVTKEQLAGLSENYINSLKRDKKGNYIVTLDYPDLHPFMENAVDEEKRKELAEKNLKQGGNKNIELLTKVLKLRGENAKLLGYKNHAEYKTEIRMAKNPKIISDFLESMVSKVVNGSDKDLDALRELKVKLTGNKKAKLEFYDIAFYSNELKKERFNVDNQKISEYFPLETVKSGMFEIYSKLLSVKFEKLSRIKLWHEDVEFFSIKDSKGNLIGYFALDLYPRDGKYGHACVAGFISGHIKNSKGGEVRVPPMQIMLANFPKPSKSSPSLLTHGDVNTFFHEFGHLIHNSLSKTKYASHSGFGVTRDFVEMPSQMFENWVWDKKMLKILSGHYLDPKKKLPETLVDNLIKAKQHMVNYSTLRQLMFGTYDLIIHTKGVNDVNKLYNDLVKKYTKFTLPKDSIFPAGFGHLMGYDAGYYGYMWSLVYAQDMFTRFKKEGLLNKKIGESYKKEVLEKGSSMDEMEMVKNFLGRKPNDKAFLEELGIK